MLEPFVFTAILATYIEFPAIQDLIYTNICIQVLNDHTNDIIYNQTTNASLLSSQNNANITIASTTIAPIALPSNGRIQEFNVGHGNTTIAHHQVVHLSAQELLVGQNESADYYSICGRSNKSAISKDLMGKIYDQDSLFWLKYQLLICILSAVMSPHWGGISDRIGRVIPMNIPIVASLICNLISLAFGVLLSIEEYRIWPNLNWLFACALLIGVSGGQVTLLSNTFSFLSDNTTSDARTKRVAILESIIYIGHSLGFFLSKLMMARSLVSHGSGAMKIWQNRHFLAFGSCALLNFCSLMYSIFNLRHIKLHRFLNNFEREQREVSTSDHIVDGTPSPRLGRRSNQECNGERLRELTASTPDDLDGPIVRADKSNWTICDTMITFRYYKETYLAAMKPRESRIIILQLYFACFISALSLAALMSLLYVYVRMEPFNWSTNNYSSWNSMSSLVKGTALISLTLCMRFYSGWCVPDALVAALGFLSKFTGLLTLGLAQSPLHLYYSIGCFTFSEYVMPPIRSLFSKLVAKEELGKIYSFMGSLQSICFILGNIAFYVAFSYTIARQDYFRVTFIVTSILELIAAITMLIIYNNLKRRTLII